MPLVAKVCSKCGIKKPLSDFYKDRARKDGHRPHCKKCKNAINKRWRDENWSKELETTKIWRKANRERRLITNTKWRKNNLGKDAAKTAKRHAAKLQATPKWLTKSDYAMIEAFYVEARELTQATGIQYHVDHIIPLQGEGVRGLHVPWNLQVITAEENLRKYNKLEEAYV